MPILWIAGFNYGAPDTLKDELKTAVASIPELEIGPEQVAVRYINEEQSDDGWKEINIFVFGLSKKPKRTREVRDRLAKAIQQTVAQYFSKGILVECFVMPYAIGFSTNHK
jgi:hypothetical protein